MDANSKSNCDLVSPLRRLDRSRTTRAMRQNSALVGRCPSSQCGSAHVCCAEFAHCGVKSRESCVSDQVKYVLDETDIPKTWYNLTADLPKPLPPVLHPGTKQPIGPADLEPLFPMELILQEVSAERYIDIPEPIRDVYRMWRPVAADARAPARAEARHAGQDLLQVRRRLAGRLAQAEHRGGAGLVQQAGRDQAAQHRDRRRAMGLVARLRRRAVRHRRHGVPGARVLRPEALPPRADGDLRRALHRVAVERDRIPAAPS